MPFHIVRETFIILIRLWGVFLNIIKIVFIVTSVIYLVLFVAFCILTKKPFKTILFNAVVGLFAFVIIDLTSIFTGVWIPINDYTVAVSILGGFPGTLLLVIARFLLFGV